MQNMNRETPCIPCQFYTSGSQIASNAQNYSTGSRSAVYNKIPTEYPRPIYEPTGYVGCQTTCCSKYCQNPHMGPCPAPYPTCPRPCPPQCHPGCHQPHPPICPPPCPPPCCCKETGLSNAHVGISGATLLIGGPTGTIPIDQIFTQYGNDICGVNPFKIRGPHTYLVEWSGAIDPIDDLATVQMELLLDGTPIKGSGNYTDITASVEGAVALSGGAIVNVPAGCHTLELGYTTGASGAEVSKINIRIVELT